MSEVEEIPHWMSIIVHEGEDTQNRTMEVGLWTDLEMGEELESSRPKPSESFWRSESLLSVPGLEGV